MMEFAIATVLDRALKDAGVPIEGVSIGDETDRTTWTAHYQKGATDEQRKAGEALLASLDPHDATTTTAIKADVSSARLNDELLRAIVQGVHECLPAPVLTLPQLRQRILAIYRTLL